VRKAQPVDGETWALHRYQETLTLDVGIRAQTQVSGVSSVV